MSSQALNSSTGSIGESGDGMGSQRSLGPTPSLDPKEAVFFEWLKKGGAYFPDVEIKELNGCRGVYAKRAIKAGEVFIRIPTDLCLYNNDDEFGFLSESLADWSNLYNYMPIVIRLMFEQMDPQSRWRPYLDFLPSRVESVASCYSERHKDLLVKSAAWSDFHEFASDYLEEWNHLSGLENELNQFSKTQLYWAREMYFSRAFRGHCFGWEEKVLFIPLFDMCNHVYDASMSLRYNKENNCFEGVADRDIAVDEEITFYYGNHTNAYFLIMYGFTFDENPLKALRLPFKEYMEDQSITYLATEKYLDDLFTVSSDSNESFYKVMAQLRAWVREGVKTVGESLTPHYEIGSDDEEQAVYTLLLELCDRRLAQLPEGLKRRMLVLMEEPNLERFNEYNLMNVYNDEALLLRELQNFAKHQLKPFSAQKHKNRTFQELFQSEGNHFGSLYAAQKRKAGHRGGGQ